MNFNTLVPNAEKTVQGTLIGFGEDLDRKKYFFLQDDQEIVIAINYDPKFVNASDMATVLVTGIVKCSKVYIERLAHHVQWEAHLTKDSQVGTQHLTSGVPAGGVKFGTIWSFISDKGLPIHTQNVGTKLLIQFVRIDLPNSFHKPPEPKRGCMNLPCGYTPLKGWYFPDDKVYVHLEETVWFRLENLPMGRSVVFSFMEMSYYIPGPTQFNAGELCITFNTTTASSILDASFYPGWVKTTMDFEENSNAGTTAGLMQGTDEDFDGFASAMTPIAAKIKSPRKHAVLSPVQMQSPLPIQNSMKKSKSPAKSYLDVPQPTGDEWWFEDSNRTDDAQPVVLQPKSPHKRSKSPAVPPPQSPAKAQTTQSPAPTNPKIVQAPRRATVEVNVVPVPTVKRPRVVIKWGIDPPLLGPEHVGKAVQFRDTDGSAVNATLCGGGALVACIHYGEGKITKRPKWSDLKLPD